MLRGLAAHQCRCDMTIVLYSRSAVWASGICHIKYALWVTSDISRFTGLSYQQSNYPPPTFSKERNGRLCLYLFSFLLIFYIYYCHMFILCSTYSRRIFMPNTPPIPMFAMPGTATMKGVLIRAYDIFIHILL